MAFGIDAWWSARQARLEEREAIAQLATDFQANAARLDTIRSIHETALEASYEILARAGMGGAPRSDQRTAELVWHSLRAWTYDPVLGGINSLVQSGQLGLLRNDSLRVAVAGWPDIVEDLNGDELLESENTFGRLAPYLIARGTMHASLLSVGALDRLGVRDAPDVTELLSDSVYLQMISWRVNGLENVLSEVETVDQSIQRILRLLDGG